MQTTTNIVHEAEVQRQHIRLQLPAEIQIGEKGYTTYDWSNGGFAIQLTDDTADAALTKLKQGMVTEGTMKFQFEGFQLLVPMQFEVRYANKGQHRIGCRFTNVEKRHIAIFQYLVSAYVAGEVVQIGDLLDVAGRNNYTTGPKKVPSVEDTLTPGQRASRKMKNVLRTALVAAVSLFLVGYLVTGFYERAFVVKASSGEVVADMISLDAPAGGKVNYVPMHLDTKVAKGDPLVSMMTDTGSLQSVDSPCDCFVKDRLMQNNQHANKDQSLLMLVPVDAKPLVRARVNYEDAVRIHQGQTAVLDLAGNGQRMNGMVMNIQGRDAKGGTGAIIEIQPEVPLMATQIDDPVAVRFDTGIFH